MKAKTLSNAIWNVVNGSSSALVAVIVPPFLTRLLAPDAYGAWAVALQIGAYVGLFGFGIQMAVGRYVAYCDARGDREQRDGIVATAFWFLTTASVAAFLVILAAAFSIQRLLPELDPALVGQTRSAIVLVGLSLAINLPASVFAAIFTGLQRSHVPAQIQGAGRILLACGLIAAGQFRDIGVLGLVYVLISALTVAGLWFAWRTRTPAPSLALRKVSAAHGRELASFCFSLTIWNFAMLMVSGLDLLIVGRYDYASTAFFAVSVTLTTLVSGVLSSLAGALVPAAASVDHAEGTAELRTLLFRASRLILAASIVVSAPLIFQGQAILNMWVGPGYAARATILLAVLVLATLIRNAMVPYVTVAIGIGYQRRMFATPLVEGAVSVIASVVLCLLMGAIGVAVAKAIGAVVGVALLLVQHPLKQPLGGVSRFDYFRHCVMQPALALIPIAAVGWLVDRTLPDVGLVGPGLIFAAAVVAVWFFTLSSEDRTFAIQVVRHRGSLRHPSGPRAEG